MTFNIDKLVNHFGKGSLIVIVITFILFTVALFVKGFTHDLLIEIAVFLVSVKLILMTYSNSMTAKKLETKLNDIDHKIDRLLEKEQNEK
jgi:c-di-AMP phosphodiesterase-like protein